MMEIPAVIKIGTALVTFTGVVGGGAWTLNEAHEPRGAAEKVEQKVMAEITADRSSRRVDTILRIVDDAARSEDPNYKGLLCMSLDAEFIQLCTEQPSHYLCTDPEAIKSLKAKAGCE
jgi:hypothetical protein